MADAWAKATNWPVVGKYIGWLMGEKGIILRSVDGGDSWPKQDSGTEADLNAVFAVDE